MFLDAAAGLLSVRHYPAMLDLAERLGCGYVLRESNAYNNFYVLFVKQNQICHIMITLDILYIFKRQYVFFNDI